MIYRKSILIGILMTAISATLTKPKSYEIRKVNSSCSSDEIKIRLEFNRNFQGIVYAKGFPLVKTCSSFGTGETFVDLSIDTSGCGVRLLSINDETLTFRISLNVQLDKFLQQITDLEVSATCDLPLDAMHSKRVTSGSRTGRNKFADVKSDQGPDDLSNRVKTWMEIEGISSESNNVNKVFVGERTMMLIKSFLPENTDVGVLDCLAYDGTRDVAQKLLDENGCPLDESIMPQLEPLKLLDSEDGEEDGKTGEESIPEEGESGKEKGTADEFAEESWKENRRKKKRSRLRVMGTMFSAFKFPDTSNLHLKCSLQICRKTCPKVSCDSESSRDRTGKSVKSDGSHVIEKIEVFNSVEVLAPGIDADGFSPNQEVGNSKINSEEDSFCLSASKMAFSFAILGAVFLCGVLAALWTIMRNHMRKVNKIDGSEQILVVRDSPLNFTNSRKMHRNWSYS